MFNSPKNIILFPKGLSDSEGAMLGYSIPFPTYHLQLFVLHSHSLSGGMCGHSVIHTFPSL